MIRSLHFDGFRSFPSRRQYARSQSQPFQVLELAPLTLLVGRNNSGKTSVAELLYRVLAGLAGAGKEALPLSVSGLPAAASFQDLLPARDANAFLELNIKFQVKDCQHRLEEILYLPSLMQDDLRPWARSIQWDGQDSLVPEGPLEQGLLPPEIPDRAAVQEAFSKLLRSSVWLGPLREPVPEIPQRKARQQNQIGPAGQNAIELLSEDDELFKTVSDWLREHAGFSLRWEKNLDLWRMNTVRGTARNISITQAGAGIHQLLPILTLAKWRQLRCGDVQFIDVVQQPELHLHDALQSALGDMFIDAALAAGQGVTVVETHAEGLLLRVRRRIAEGKIKPGQVGLYYVDDNHSGSSLRRIDLREDGEVDWWPEGVFLESFEEVKALRQAQRRRS
uniref:AAA family ATPase n=1 Tax=Candidatus Electronema sp. TaxID=2698783 RepID=UPI004056889C